MFSISAVSSVTPNLVRRGFRDVAGITLAAAALLAIGAQAAVAQTSTEPQPATTQGPNEHVPRWDFLVASGTLIPTGVQRGDIRRANQTAVQLLYVVRPELALTATIGWARSRDSAEQRLDVFSYDLGVEARPVKWMLGSSATFSPFIGVGAGARSYNTRNSEADTTHRVAAYASIGGDLAIRRVHLRLEVRDYVSGSSGQSTGGVRNDAVAMLGLYFTGQ